MNARLERKLRVFTGILIGGMAGGTAYVIARVGMSPSDIGIGLVYGLLISSAIATFEFIAASGRTHAWLGSLSFSASLLARSAIYAAIILPIQYFDLGVRLAGLSPDPTRQDFLSATLFSAVFSVLMNLIVAILNIIGARSFFHLATGRYHAPVEEKRFVLFVDIAGSTSLAEKLGGIGIHRFLDRTFCVLSEVVVDYRGEVLNYVGDEIIVTWPAKAGFINWRPLRCFLAMREALDGEADQFELDFGAVPKIRGSLHFGDVIVGEIGSIKRAIVFNGDVMNTAARLEASSRDVEGGFLMSRVALEQFGSAPPVALGAQTTLSVRGKADGADVVGLADSSRT